MFLKKELFLNRFSNNANQELKEKESPLQTFTNR